LRAYTLSYATELKRQVQSRQAKHRSIPLLCKEFNSYTANSFL